MENASKALLMAAGVLIGVLVLSLAVYLFITFGASAREIRARIDDSQISKFNSNFTIYSGREDITIYDIISLANLAQENNEYYKNYADFETNYKITVKLGTEEIQNKTQEQKQTLLQANNGTDLSAGELIKKYHLKQTANSGIKYNSIGRVSKVQFQEKNP